MAELLKPIAIIKNTIIDALNAICPDNVFLQGSMNPDEAYPDTFITFYIPSTDMEMWFDNDPKRLDVNVIIMVYSNDPESVITTSDSVVQAMRGIGCICSNYGNDIMSDEPTHSGWAMDFIYPYNMIVKIFNEGENNNGS